MAHVVLLDFGCLESQASQMEAASSSPDDPQKAIRWKG